MRIISSYSTIFTILFSILLLVPLQACSDAGTTQKSQTRSLNNELVLRAKQVTADYKLTTTQIACLDFKVAEDKYEGRDTVDVFEIHGGKCPGDPATSPRIYSIAFDVRGEIWSDANSLVGQMEKLEKRKTKR